MQVAAGKARHAHHPNDASEPAAKKLCNGHRDTKGVRASSKAGAAHAKKEPDQDY